MQQTNQQNKMNRHCQESLNISLEVMTIPASMKLELLNGF